MGLIVDDIIAENVMDGVGFRTGNDVAATSASTKQLVRVSSCVQTFTGTTAGQILKLPDATTLNVGHRFLVQNVSTQAIAVKDYGDNLILTSLPSARVLFVLRDKASSAGIWDKIVSGVSTFSASMAPVLASYGANANVGRYLEFYPDQDSLEAPLQIPAQGIVIGMILGTSAINTGTIGLFKSSDLGTSIQDISVSSASEKVLLNLAVPISQYDKLSLRVTSGVLSKPRVSLWLSGT